MNLNFNGTTVASIYSDQISHQRAEELIGIFKREAEIMVDQYESYTVTLDDGDGNGEYICIFRGKVMQRLLEFATNEYELMFIAHSFERIVDYLNKRISNRILAATIEENFK